MTTGPILRASCACAACGARTVSRLTPDLPDDAPNRPGFSPGLIARFMGARIAMALGR